MVEIEFNKKKYSFSTNLIGKIQVKNILFSILAASRSKIKFNKIIESIKNIKPVEGRLEIIGNIKNNSKVILDYAHTPDALKNILLSINKIRTKNESLLTIIGCGGDRDKKKRPKIGEVAAKFSSKVIFTSDNPRNEDPESIINEMITGVSPVDFKKTRIFIKREEAISAAYKETIPGDIVLIAGKGHEKYQEIKGKKYPFNDLECARKIFIKT